MLKEITTKVLNSNDIPYEIIDNSWLCDICGNNGMYVKYSLSDYNDELSDWIKENYPEIIGETFLISF